MLRPLYLILCLSFSLAACGPKVNDYLNSKREMSRSKLLKLEEIRKMLPMEVNHGDETLTEPGPMSICEFVVPQHRDEGCDTWIVTEKQLFDAGRYERPVISYGQVDWLVLPTALMMTGRYPPNENYPQGGEVRHLTRAIEYAFRWLAQVQYVIVIRTIDMREPELDEKEEGYHPGHFEGDAVLFALEPTVKSYGYVPFSYEMKGDITVRMKQSVIQQSALNRVFAKGVRDALAWELVRLLPNLERPDLEPTPEEAQEQ